MVPQSTSLKTSYTIPIVSEIHKAFRTFQPIHSELFGGFAPNFSDYVAFNRPVRNRFSPARRGGW